MCARHDVVAPAPTVYAPSARQMLTLQGLSQNADHLAHNSPFPTLVAEVVCTLGRLNTRAGLHTEEMGL